MQFWDKLPPEERRKHIRSRLTPSRVLLLHCNFTNPPKDKFLVVVATNPEPLCFIVNSAVNEFTRRRNDLMQCQVEIGHEAHSFLKHHSFIDCTTAHRIAMEDIFRQLENDFDRLKGKIDALTRDQIVAAVKFAKTLTPKQKTEILAGLTLTRSD